MSKLTEAQQDAADRAERLMSMSKAAALLGRDRDTLSAWAKKGMPVARRGDAGSSHLVDLKDVISWREEQVRREERARFPGGDGDGDGEGLGGRLSPADAVKIEDAKIKRLKLAMLAKILVHREPMEMGIRQANGLGRQTVMSIPDLVSRLLAGSVSREKSLEIRRAVRTTCAAAMTSWATEVAAAMKAAADRAMDLGDDEDDDEES